jgi:hypothetical protein
MVGASEGETAHSGGAVVGGGEQLHTVRLIVRLTVRRLAVLHAHAAHIVLVHLGRTMHLSGGVEKHNVTSSTPRSYHHPRSPCHCSCCASR